MNGADMDLRALTDGELDGPYDGGLDLYAVEEDSVAE